MGLIDDWMPAADETSRHSIVIEAPVDEVWQALFRTDLTRHPVTASLLALRSLPSFVLSPRQTLQRARHTRGSGGIGLKAILSSEFVLLDERPPREVVFGVTGQFWRPAGNLTTSDPATFRDAVPEGLARAAWSFELDARGATTVLATETRVLCGGEAALRSFRRYWRLIRPFSGLIRTLVLGQVRREAARSVT